MNLQIVSWSIKNITFLFFKECKENTSKDEDSIFQNKAKIIFTYAKWLILLLKARICPRTETDIIQSCPTCKPNMSKSTTFEELVKAYITLMKILFSQWKQNKLSTKFFSQITVTLHIILMHLMWKSNYICLLEDCLICI